MTGFVALLRAVNVGGTGRLPMALLKAICEDAGFDDVRTYLASGNALFTSALSEAKVRTALEKRLLAHFGKPVGVLVRSAAEMQAVAAGNPFADRPANRVVAIFLDAKPPHDAIEQARGRVDEEIVVSKRREIYVCYGEDMGHSKLRIPAAVAGTGRNMKTVASLATMAAECGRPAAGR